MLYTKTIWNWYAWHFYKGRVRVCYRFYDFTCSDVKKIYAESNVWALLHATLMKRVVQVRNIKYANDKSYYFFSQSVRSHKL